MAPLLALCHVCVLYGRLVRGFEGVCICRSGAGTTVPSEMDIGWMATVNLWLVMLDS